jgi:AraC-like DNA-binding protein
LRRVKVRFPGTLPAIFALRVVHEAGRRGVPPAAFLSGAGLSETSLAEPEVRLSTNTVFAVYEIAMRRIRDDGLPVTIARMFALEDVPILGFAVMTAATSREAIARAIRFGSIVSTSGRWTLEERGDLARLRWHRDGPRTLGHRVANEAAVAEFVHATRQTLGAEVQALATSFRHAAPSDVRAHRAHFGPRIMWRADVDEVVFPRPMLDAVPRLSNPALSTHFERQAQRLLAQESADAPLPTRVRRAVEHALPSGEPAATLIAKQLAMSERTLRRALAAQGSSFRAIVEAARHDRARLLLEDPRASLAEIALSLGFSELSAFSRAFKRWTGRSPSDARALVVRP